MKKVFSFAFVLLIAGACNNSSSDTVDDTSGPGTPGVQNTNGNIPDSNNSINLNHSQPVDSVTGRDSAQKR